jgi:hypothetical protein
MVPNTHKKLAFSQINKQRSDYFIEGYLIVSHTLWKLCYKYPNWMLYIL